MRSTVRVVPAILILTVLALSAAVASAQSLKIQGNIISRAGNTMTVKTSDGSKVVV